MAQSEERRLPARFLGWSIIAAYLLLAVSAHAQEPVRQWSGKPLEGATIENFGNCCPDNRGKVISPDNAVIVKTSGMAARRNQLLWLKLDGDRTLRLADCLPENGCDGDRRFHRLVAWWPKQRIFVVNVYLHEDQVAYLVSQREGRVLVTTAPPVLSPSGRQAIAVQSNNMYGVTLELLDLANEPPTLTRIEEMPRCRGASTFVLLRPTPVWIGDSQVRFEGRWLQSDGDPNTKQLLRIGDGKPRWEC